ncbi:MAG: response regulator transcription factor [Syntrophomonadaceae bacterium]|jgi:DNA-binding NarL/FixJ family response regulator|nr:response regulator transcription factor [Syntrophomonadaceae bacterium]MDH7497062.1 response regulator transcription factor [Syntrophomonadaceae bacterium]
MSEFRILLGGHSLEWCEALAAAFLKNPLFEVAGTADAEVLVDRAAGMHPDIVLWDAGEEDPGLTVRELCVKCPFTHPVVIVSDPRRLDINALLKAGLRGCLPARLLPCQVVEAVELIVKAGILCLPRLNPDSLSGGNGRNGELAALDTLTAQERRVLALLGESMSNQEIASALYLSESTVKAHLRNIFQKLGVRNRTQALMLAMKAGIVEPRESRPSSPATEVVRSAQRMTQA